MKTFIAALVILSLTLGLVAGGTALALHACDLLCGIAEQFPQEGEDFETARRVAQQLKSTFDGWEGWLQISVPHDDITHTEEFLSELIGAVDAEDTAAFETALAGFRGAMEHLRRAVLPMPADFL